MFNKIMGLMGFGGPEHDAKVLIRDARAMIEMICGQHGPESLGKIASTIRERIELVHEKGLNDPQYYGRGVDELTELNRAARSRRDNISWSGITIAIIYIKAEILGELALPAKNRIDGFVDEYIPATPPDKD